MKHFCEKAKIENEWYFQSYFETNNTQDEVYFDDVYGIKKSNEDRFILYENGDITKQTIQQQYIAFMNKHDINTIIADCAVDSINNKQNDFLLQNQVKIYSDYTNSRISQKKDVIIIFKVFSDMGLDVINYLSETISKYSRYYFYKSEQNLFSREFYIIVQYDHLITKVDNVFNVKYKL